MKIRDGFVLRDVAGKTLVVAVGELSKEFQGMITLNETGKFIWECLLNDTTKEEIVSKMTSEYDAPEEVISEDVEKFLNKLKKDNIIE